MPFRRREEDPRGRKPTPPPGRERPRQRPEVEEERVEAEPRGGFRRTAPEGGSPWRREWEPMPGGRAEPLRQEKRRRLLWDILVPESEQEDPDFDYRQIFSALLPSPRGGGRGEMPPPRGGQEQPRGGEYRPGGGGPAPTHGRPGRTREGPPVVDPKNWFNLEAITQAARQVRADQRFKKGHPVALVQIAPASPNEMARAAHLIRFFRIPKQEVDRHPGESIWSALLHPFLDELSYAINVAKPAELPGDFGFQAAPNGSFWLAYMER